MKKKTLNKRNLKYGGAATAFTAVVVAAVILLNLVIASLGNTFSWYADLTGKSVYTMSEEFEKNLEGENWTILVSTSFFFFKNQSSLLLSNI